MPDLASQVLVGRVEVDRAEIRSAGSLNMSKKPRPGCHIRGSPDLLPRF